MNYTRNILSYIRQYNTIPENVDYQQITNLTDEFNNTVDYYHYCYTNKFILSTVGQNFNAIANIKTIPELTIDINYFNASQFITIPSVLTNIQTLHIIDSQSSESFTSSFPITFCFNHKHDYLKNIIIYSNNHIVNFHFNNNFPSFETIYINNGNNGYNNYYIGPIQGHYNFHTPIKAFTINKLMFQPMYQQVYKRPLPQSFYESQKNDTF